MSATKNQTSILIAGVGNLGFRYLQGALSRNDTDHIFIYERNPLRVNELLQTSEFQSNISRVSVLESLNKLPNKLDIAIISTSAEPRLKVVSEIEESSKVSYWILEKVLCQSTADLDGFNSFAQRNRNAWVNTFFRSVEMFAGLKARLHRESPLKIRVTGGNWGLACNTVHFLDFSEWLAEDKVTQMSTSLLDPKWIPAKRPGFWEATGQVQVKFEKGSTLDLSCDTSTDPLEIAIYDGREDWLIRWDQGVTESKSGVILDQGIPYQSQMTPKLITSLIERSTTNLTPLHESIAQHSFLIESLLGHWNSQRQQKDQKLPIT